MCLFAENTGFAFSHPGALGAEEEVIDLGPLQRALNGDETSFVTSEFSSVTANLTLAQRVHLAPFTLRFDERELEVEFQDAMARKFVTFARIVGLVTASYCSFAACLMSEFQLSCCFRVVRPSV